MCLVGCFQTVLESVDKGFMDSHDGYGREMALDSRLLADGDYPATQAEAAERNK